MRVRIRGVTYETITGACSALDVSRKVLSRHLDDGTEDQIGVVSPSGKKLRPDLRKPVVIRGVTYASVSIAAEELGVWPSTIFFAKRRGTLDGVGLQGWPRNKPFMLGGVRYESVSAAARALLRSRAWVKARITYDAYLALQPASTAATKRAPAKTA